MKRLIYSILLFSGVSFTMAACSNGDYDANPSSNANNTINPLNPLDSAALSAYVVAGTPSFIKASINGGGFSSSGDTTTSWVLDASGTNIITGISGNTILTLYLKSVYAVNIYGMGYKNMITWGAYAVYDTGANARSSIYYSYVGNSGEVQILQNDPTTIRGAFYFQGVDSTGDVVNVTNGYFDIAKPL